MTSPGGTEVAPGVPGMIGEGPCGRAVFYLRKGKGRPDEVEGFRFPEFKTQGQSREVQLSGTAHAQHARGPGFSVQSLH